MRDVYVDEETRRYQDDRTDDNGLGRGRTDKTEQDLDERYWRGQDLEDRTRELA
jgi:hypothetical protein